MKRLIVIAVGAMVNAKRESYMFDIEKARRSRLTPSTLLF